MEIIYSAKFIIFGLEKLIKCIAKGLIKTELKVKISLTQKLIFRK